MLYWRHSSKWEFTYLHHNSKIHRNRSHTHTQLPQAGLHSSGRCKRTSRKSTSNLWWYFLLDFHFNNLKCFQCRSEGHLAKHCPNFINDSQQQIKSSSLPIQVIDTNNEDSFPPLSTEKQQSLNKEYKGPAWNKISNKRSLSTSSNSSQAPRKWRKM